MAEGIFKMDDSKKEMSEETFNVYTMVGKHEWLDEEGFPRLSTEREHDVDAYAKSVTYQKADNTGDKTHYLAKRGRHGKLYNPFGMYTEGTAGHERRHTGRPEWTFQRINERTFNFYINFLRTKNPAWLHNAERE